MSNQVTQLTVFNLALQQLGITETLASVNDDSDNAGELRKAYPLVLNSALASHNWDFATKHVQLSLISDSDNLTEYQFLFSEPADAVRIWSIYNDKPTNPIEYKSTSEGIYTDSETTYAEYTYDNQNFAEYSTDFKEYLVFKLAEFAAPSLLNSDSRSQQLASRAGQSQLKAASQGIVQHPKTYRFSSNWLTDRNVY